MLRSAADLGVPLTAVSLVHRRGYFRQRLDPEGHQFEEPQDWFPERLLEPMKPRAEVAIEGRRVLVRAWRYWIKGHAEHQIPVYLLDTMLPENSPEDQTLTDHLYGGDRRYRFCQEAILGIGGVEILEKLGHTQIATYHMNEGHAALLALALLERQIGSADLAGASDRDIDEVRRKCVFTTHTPVPAGHDQFSRDLVCQVLGDKVAGVLHATKCCPEHGLNMTFLGLRFSRYINGVAMQHGEVSQGMFPRYPIHAITNGVHATTWTSPALGQLYDRFLPGWRADNVYLRYAIRIPLEEIRQAHAQSKVAMIARIAESTGVRLDENVLTLGFARRAASYKRADLLFANPESLRWLTQHVGPLQIVFGGKAHPQDEDGKSLIRKIFAAAKGLENDIKVVYVENYAIEWAKLLTSGVDVWLNTPQRPYEASGTSGMKAALNGVPSLSILDGWWVEGCLEGTTGWAIGHGGEVPGNPAGEAASLYDKLELRVMPMFYGQPGAFREVMRSAIAINGSFFNTQRMLQQYVANAYVPEIPAATSAGELAALTGA
jgi:starch phosphorylase